MQQLAAKSGEGKVQLPHGRTLQLGRSETEMQLRRQLSHLARGGVPCARILRGGSHGHAMMSIRRTKRQRGGKRQSSHPRQYTLAWTEPPAAAPREREAIDSPRYVMTL
jgi:hypothetical protein